MNNDPSIFSVLTKVTLPMGLQLFFDYDINRQDAPYIQIVCDNGKCNVTGDNMSWKGRKWYLSYHMTDGEIVQTAFKALQTAIEHELREGFLYKGRAIFDPHYDIEKLWELRGQDDCLKERD